VLPVQVASVDRVGPLVRAAKPGKVALLLVAAKEATRVKVGSAAARGAVRAKAELVGAAVHARMARP
jgi:hypothetical protein